MTRKYHSPKPIRSSFRVGLNRLLESFDSKSSIGLRVECFNITHNDVTTVRKMWKESITDFTPH